MIMITKENDTYTYMSHAAFMNIASHLFILEGIVCPILMLMRNVTIWLRQCCLTVDVYS